MIFKMRVRDRFNHEGDGKSRIKRGNLATDFYREKRHGFHTKSQRAQRIEKISHRFPQIKKHRYNYKT